jgi:DNA polymerase-3 subunit gamma/tau
VADLLERLRDLVILAAVPDALEKGLIDAPADVVERMQAQASVFGAAELSRAADLVNTGLTEMRGATSPRLQLELICARVLLPAAYDDERSVQARLENLERRAAAGGFAAGPALASAPAPVGDFAGGSGFVDARAAVRSAGVESAVEPAPASIPEPARTPAPAAVSGRPGAWPVAGGGAPAAAPAAQRPGAWPGAGGAVAPVAQPAPAAAPAAQESPAPSAVAGDPARVRQMWPDILEAVKNRRRFTWILLSQNAQVVGFDGTTLQVGFSNPGARDSFVNGGSEDVLRQALSDALGVQWRVESIVAPSGGGGAGGMGGNGGGPAPQQAAPVARPQEAQPAPPMPPAAPAAAAARAAVRAAPQQDASLPPAEVEAPTPIEDDIPEEDDPDLDDTALTGHDLIVRELGATVIEEIANE